MIKVTKLNGKEIVVNCELIELMEATPDTTVTMNTGRKLIVAETVDEVIKKVVAYKQLIQFNRFEK